MDRVRILMIREDGKKQLLRERGCAGKPAVNVQVSRDPPQDKDIDMLDLRGLLQGAKKLMVPGDQASQPSATKAPVLAVD